MNKHDFMFLLAVDAPFDPGSVAEPRYTIINRHQVVAIYDYPGLNLLASRVVMADGTSFIVDGTTRSIADDIAGDADGLPLINDVARHKVKAAS